MARAQRRGMPSRRLLARGALGLVVGAALAGCSGTFAGIAGTSPGATTSAPGHTSGVSVRSSAPISTVSPTTPLPPPSAPPTEWRAGPTVAGVDVSPYQRTVDWAGLWASGHRFAIVKASEGSTWRSPVYAAQRDAARAVGMMVGAYHYARPSSSSAIAQARHFVAVSGGWSADGRTLPGALDLERNTSGDPCYGMTPAQLTAWIADFSGEYSRLTTRVPMIYVRADLWAQCLAGDRTIGATNPLWLYDHEAPVGPWPHGWERPTIWQRGVEANLDRNVFFGTEADLVRFATAT